MSHAGVILELLERERLRAERLEAIRIAKFPDLHEALRRAHEENIRAAGLIEAADHIRSVQLGRPVTPGARDERRSPDAVLGAPAPGTYR